jgi:hypothetical protein
MIEAFLNIDPLNRLLQNRECADNFFPDSDPSGMVRLPVGLFAQREMMLLLAETKVAGPL